MKKITYKHNGFDPFLVKIKNIIFVGIVLISVPLFFYFHNTSVILEILKIMVTFLSILFGFFIVNLVHWSGTYDSLWNRNMDILSKVISDFEVPGAYSQQEIIQMAENHKEKSIEISNILGSIKLMKKAQTTIKKRSTTTILLLVFFIIFSILFIYLMNILPTYAIIYPFSFLYILFLFIFQEIVLSSVFIHFPQIGEKLSD